MSRFFKLRDGCDWMWTDVMQPEEMIESFASSIQQEDAPGLTVEAIVAGMRVYRYHWTHRLGGEVSRLEYRAGGHIWVAERELTSTRAGS